MHDEMGMMISSTPMPKIEAEVIYSQAEMKELDYERDRLEVEEGIVVSASNPTKNAAPSKEGPERSGC